MRHPEEVDPIWFQDLVRRAFERELRRLQQAGTAPEESVERAMWHVFNLRHNLTALYQEGSANDAAGSS